MRISIYVLALMPLAFVGCAEEPTTVTTTTTTQEVTTTGPAREVVVTRTPPAVRVETQTVAPGSGYGMSRHVVIGGGPERITCGYPAVGWCDQGRPLCG